ncbi:MAG: SH3 domain-containing protein, partial [Anaerolineae bacterium]|nr:SH3 domain-containing protein [Anaerolineae bacterium]
WADLLVLAIGAIVSAVSLVQENTRIPRVGSIALAYEILLPIGAAGFGLTAHLTGLFPNALFVFAAHLFAAVLLALITLAFLRLRPRESWGFTLGASGVMTLLMALAFLGNLSPLPGMKAVGSIPTLTLVRPQISQTSTQTTPAPSLLSPSASPSPEAVFVTPGGPTFTPTNTLIPTRTPTITPSPAPTPVYAKIAAKEDAGALVRKEPDFSSPVVKSLLNGSLVEILPDSIDKNGIIWYKVRLPDGGGDGWIVRYVLVTATAVR